MPVAACPPPFFVCSLCHYFRPHGPEPGMLSHCHVPFSRARTPRLERPGPHRLAHTPSAHRPGGGGPGYSETRALHPVPPSHPAQAPHWTCQSRPASLTVNLATTSGPTARSPVCCRTGMSPPAGRARPDWNGQDLTGSRTLPQPIGPGVAGPDTQRLGRIRPNSDGPDTCFPPTPP